MINRHIQGQRYGFESISQAISTSTEYSIPIMMVCLCAWHGGYSASVKYGTACAHECGGYVKGFINFDPLVLF